MDSKCSPTVDREEELEEDFFATLPAMESETRDAMSDMLNSEEP